MEVLTRLRNPEWWQTQSLEDLYFLTRNVLSTLEDPTPGYKDLWKPTHGDLCRFLKEYAKPGHKCIVLMPRGWIKSYVATVGWTLQRVLRNLVEGKREHLIISNATIGNSREFLEKIKFNLQYNELLRAIFKKWLPENPPEQAERWTQDEISIKGNKIETGSAEGNLVSRHYTIGINDDLVNRDNSATAEQISKVIDWWKLFQSLLLPKSVELIIGTRWDEDDLYGHIIKSFLQVPSEEKNKSRIEWHKGKYHLLQLSCWADVEARTGSTFPTMFPDWKLKEIEVEQAERFGGQYLNDPIAMSNKPFKPTWLSRTWDPALLPKIVTTIMTVDPTGKEKAESDYTGMTVVDAGLDKNVYIKFAQRKLVTDLKLVEWIVEVACDHFPAVIGIEENKYSTLMELMELSLPLIIRKLGLNKEQAEYATTLPGLCMELRHRGRPKHVRILNLTGWFESGRMLLAPAGMQDVRDELLRFPSIRLFDIADALAYVLDVLTFPRATDPERYLVVPEFLKLTDEEREREEWQRLMGGRRSRGFDAIKHLY
jgi:hypothetical protein